MDNPVVGFVCTVQVPFIERLYDQRENFTDDKLYDSSRRDIYHKLAEVAERTC